MSLPPTPFTPRQSEVQNLEDAISEIEVLLEDDACRVRVGDVFITMSNDAAQARAESDLASAKQRLAGQRTEHSAIQVKRGIPTSARFGLQLV